MKLGNLIEWVYAHNNNRVIEGEELWSSMLNQWIPISGPALLINVTEKSYMFLSGFGLHKIMHHDNRSRHKDMFGINVIVHPRTVSRA